MGIFGKLATVVFYPVIRPMESVREASAQIREDLAKGRRAREAHQSSLEDQARRYAEETGEVTAEQLLNPLLITDPRKRFAAVATARGWSARELEEQLVAVRRGKRFALFAALIVPVLALVMYFTVPAWVALVLMPCLGTATVFALASVFKYGLYQFQLESKALFGGKDYLSRRDFFRHVSW